MARQLETKLLIVAMAAAHAKSIDAAVQKIVLLVGTVAPRTSSELQLNSHVAPSPAFRGC